MSKGVQKLIAMLILIVIAVYFLIPFLGSMAQAGAFSNLYLSVIEKFPFCSLTAKFIVRVAVKFVKTESKLEKYLVETDSTRTVLDLIRDFCKLCLNGVVFSVLVKAGDAVLGVSKDSKKVYFLIKVVWNMVACVFCSVIVNLILGFAFDQITLLGGKAGNFFASIVSMMALGGSAAIVALVLQAGVGVTILYILVKVFLSNVVSLLVTEIMLGLILIALSEELYLQVAVYSGYLMLCIIIMVGVGMMIDNVIKI